MTMAYGFIVWNSVEKDFIIIIFFIFYFRMAIKYIKHLQYLLSYPIHQKIPSHIVEFDPAHPAWVKAGSGLHNHLITTPPSFEPSSQIIDMKLLDMEEYSGDNVWISPEESPTHRLSKLVSPDSPPTEYH